MSMGLTGQGGEEYTTPSDKYPFEMAAICSLCGLKFGEHSGSNPQFWCPPHDHIHKDGNPYFAPIHQECKYPLRPTAEQVYEALSGT